MGTTASRFRLLSQHVGVARFLVDSHPQRPTETHNVATSRTGHRRHLLDGHPLHARRLARVLTFGEAAGQESHRDLDRLIGVDHETTVRSGGPARPWVRWCSATACDVIRG